MNKAIHGAISFKKGAYPKREDLFKKLATSQKPEVLFVTCADSRIDPNMITQSEPGELFICRNAGNIIPPHSLNTGGMTASIEYAVAVLGVQHIIVCGHTDCGAMKGALNMDGLKELPHVHNWLSHTDAARILVEENFNHLDEHAKLRKLIEENVLSQLQHLRTHPYVNSRLNAGKITLHGWVYDIEHGTFTSYDFNKKQFIPLAQEECSALHNKAGK
jgi:carbonic anhydrase